LNRVSSENRILQDVSLPKTKDGPAIHREGAIGSCVTLAIAADLGNPIVGVSARGELSPQGRPAPPMPEIAVAEDSNTSSREDQVWATHKTARMHDKTQPALVHFLAQHSLCHATARTISRH